MKVKRKVDEGVLMPLKIPDEIKEIVEENNKEKIIEAIKKFIKEDKLGLAHILIVVSLNKQDKLRYGIFALETLPYTTSFTKQVIEDVRRFLLVEDNKEEIKNKYASKGIADSLEYGEYPAYYLSKAPLYEGRYSEYFIANAVSLAVAFYNSYIVGNVNHYVHTILKYGLTLLNAHCVYTALKDI